MVSRRTSIIASITLSACLSAPTLLAQQPCTEWAKVSLQSSAEEAAKQYQLALQADPTRSCQQADEVVAALLRRTRIIAYSGDLETALAWFRKAVETAALPQQGKTGSLAASHTAAFEATRAALREVAFAEPLRLAKLGRNEEARTQLESQMKTYHWLGPPAELEALTSNWLLHFFNAFNSLFSFWLPLVLPLLSLGWLVWLRFGSKPQLLVKEGAAEPPEDAFSTLLHYHLLNLTRGSSSSGVDQVVAPVEKIEELTQVQSLVPATVAPWLKMILGVAEKLNLRRTLELSYQFHSSTSQGAGVTLHLSRSKSLFASQTIWQKDFQAGGCQHSEDLAKKHLAEYAAIWLLFQLQRATEEWFWFGRLWTRLRRSPAEFQILGTSLWRSYALARAAVQCNDEKHQRELYLRALDRDPALRMARVNVARLLLRAISKKKFNSPKRTSVRVHVIELLRRVKAEAEKSTFSHDPTWFTATYSLATLEHVLGNLEEATEFAQELVDMIEHTKSTLQHSGEEALRIYLSNIEPTARLVLGSLRVCTSQTQEEYLKGLEMIRIVDEGSASDRTQYSFACTFSLLAEWRTTASKTASWDSVESEERYLDRSISHLTRCLMLSERMRDEIKKDCTLDYVKHHAHTKKRFKQLTTEVQKEAEAA